MDDGKKEVVIPQHEHDRPSRRDLNIHVVPSVAIRWKALGEELLHRDIVETGYLEIIEKNNPNYVEECCRQMFIKWLETDKDASWKQLITALQSSVQLNTLAEQIKKKLQKGIAPVITSHPPQGIQMQHGHKVTLEVMADGTKPLQFQWYYEDIIIDGENKSFYSIFPVTIMNTGHYYCQVKNQYGEVKSTIATLTVTKTPTAQQYSRFPYNLKNIVSDKGLAVPQIQGIHPSADLRMSTEAAKQLDVIQSNTESLGHKIFSLEPAMHDLNRIVIPKVKAEWEDVAFALGYKIPIVEDIKRRCRENPMNCCKELFKDWLTTSNGAKPKKWQTLLNKLKEIETLCAATEEIMEKLIQMDSQT